MTYNESKKVTEVKRTRMLTQSHPTTDQHILCKVHQYDHPLSFQLCSKLKIEKEKKVIIYRKYYITQKTQTLRICPIQISCKKDGYYSGKNQNYDLMQQLKVPQAMTTLTRSTLDQSNYTNTSLRQLLKSLSSNWHPSWRKETKTDLFIKKDSHISTES